MKTAKQIINEQAEAAKNLPTETKKKFWEAMVEEGKNVGEAREIAGIDDIGIAAALVIQCHSIIHVPMAVDDIE